VGTARIAELMGSIARALALEKTGPDYVATAKPTGSASRRNLRAYLGTIPEYGNTNADGVKLSGIAKGGPSAQAGLKSGDVIVELAGRKIENIYDYTYALNALKVGQPVEIIVRRDTNTLSFTVTPASRE
jgi:S1-C subfamily serine protease